VKIINALWEKRNLEVETVEFIIENDDIEKIVPNILTAEKSYNVVKLPVNKPLLATALQQNGYNFVECMLNFTHDLNEIKVTNAKLLSNAEVTYEPMNKTDLEKLLCELAKGLFNTDRIFNDNRFQKEASALRYKNWLCDEHAKGSVIFKLVFQSETIGFFALKKMTHNIYDPFLLGLYNNYKGKGFGRSMAFNALQECINQGAKGISTHISSNNLANIKIYQSLGYDISGLVYVFVKHNK